MDPNQYKTLLRELEAKKAELSAEIAEIYKAQFPLPTLNGRQLRPDGFYYDRIDGIDLRVCEDCEKPIPRYRDFPQGLTSPESDSGSDDWNMPKKSRMAVVEGKECMEVLRKAVCLDCYLAAFQRVYPEAAVPDLSRILMDGTEAYKPDEIPEYAPSPGQPKFH